MKTSQPPVALVFFAETMQILGKNGNVAPHTKRLDTSALRDTNVIASCWRYLLLTHGKSSKTVQRHEFYPRLLILFESRIIQ